MLSGRPTRLIPAVLPPERAMEQTVKKKISYNVCTSIQLLKDLHSQPVLRHEKREDQLDRWHDVGGMSVQYSTC